MKLSDVCYIYQLSKSCSDFFFKEVTCLVTIVLYYWRLLSIPLGVHVTNEFHLLM